MKKNIIKITKLAGEKIIKIASYYKTKNMLFYVKGGGCNGFNYKLKPIHDINIIDKKDEIFKYESINIVICSKSLLYLLGTTIDYKKDIMGDMFYFENPNSKTKCGCGTSFSI
ncbi:MAG: hypothetical protein CBD97_02095 [Pelagibacteraceae bacterium TMED237]|nr:MAG: hypothetical protein CBD97_02095 [Pelagibacteraceae bacterium TMED237]|tara:strand:+ start:6592 stop:6930 length:339 start_codon:yes stop_codon:yes gene_type:complete